MQSTLHLRLVRGEDLPSADSNGLSDPYCILRVDGEQKQKSETIYKTLNPEWNQDFYFDEKLGGLAKTLQVEVWDRDSMSADKLGTAELDLSTLVAGEPTEFKLELSHPKRAKNGRVVLVLDRKTEASADAARKRRESEAKSTSGMGVGAVFNAVKTKATKTLSSIKPTVPNGGKGVKRQITIDVIQARGIPVMDVSTQSADPYVVLRLAKKKKTTSIKFHTRRPEWKERFVFTLFDMGGRDSSVLELALWDKDTIGMDDKIGTLKIDLAQLPLGQTDERFWKCTKYEQKTGVFGFGGKAKPAVPVSGEEEADVEILLLITVADLFEPALQPAELLALQRASKGWLKTSVHQARDLGAFDSNGKSDPFVVVQLGNKHMRTHTVKANLNPEWDAVLEMPVTEIFDCVAIDVFDEDSNGKFELMGRLRIPLLRIENGKRKWYQLKDANLLHAAEGYIQLSFHLNYLKLPMLLKSIGRRPPKHMQKDEEFKLALLKSHINRLVVYLPPAVEGAIMLNKCMTWELSPFATIAFCIGWIFFWGFVQPWHLTFGGLLAVLTLGMLKFRGKRVKTNIDVDELNGEEEEEEGAEEDEEEEVKETKAAAKNPGGMMAQMRQMKAMAQLAQNLLGATASNVERLINLFSWETPYLTLIVCAGLAMATVGLFLVPFRFWVMLLGLNRVALKGLKKYHPKFKRGKYHIPYIPAIEFIGRVPDNLEIEQQRLLPVPTDLQ